MKTHNKFLVATLLAVGLIFLNSKSNSQTYAYGSGVSSPPPTHDVLQSQHAILAIMGGTGTSTSTTLTYLGVNTETPTHLLDIYGGDVNIGSAANNTGYMIGGNPVLYTGGDNTSIFAGQQVPLAYSFTTNLYNTCTGFKAGSLIFNSMWNTVSGCFAGQKLSSSGFNTFSGDSAGASMVSGYSDTYCGARAGVSDVTGAYNTFLGFQAGYSTTGSSAHDSGDFNTMTGYDCGYYNNTGKGNDYYGKGAGYHNLHGSINSMYGSHSGNGHRGGYTADSNSFFGNYSADSIFQGNCNVIMGIYAGCNTGNFYSIYYSSLLPSDKNVFIGGRAATVNPGGHHNIVLGYGADAYTGAAANPGDINNAVAIGADAWVQHDNQFILGNNAHFVGIGMVGDVVGPAANLEIKTDQNPSAPYGQYGYIGSGQATTPTNFYNGTGFSGLKFHDLTSFSNPVDQTYFTREDPYPLGVLSVDGYGNVIYIPAPAASLGTCSSPTVADPTYGDAIDMNSQNFNFFGNSAGSGVNNVGIGLSTCTPNAKLEVLQNSGSPNTIGELVTNEDASNGSSSGGPQALIGIKSLIPGNTSLYNVAGWFEADQYSELSTREYAIFVPEVTNIFGTFSGGTVDIGFPFSTDYPTYLLKVNDYAQINGVVVPSDTVLKRNITAFKYGLKAIRNLNPISYKYNGIGGFDSTHTYIGLIAENLERNVPGAVRSTIIIKDTTTHDTANIRDIYEEGVLYTAINAIKQLDSIVTSITHKDSIKEAKQQLTNDSLRNYITCLEQLCPGGDGHSRIRNKNGGGGGSGDSNTTVTTIQDVTLSLTNEPLLYQNIPNPFSQNTKINYYLPEGTQGAYIVFYDNYGNQMKQVPLSQTGNGTLNITPDNLTSGIYSYSLVVNNKVIDTKRMILQK